MSCINLLLSKKCLADVERPKDTYFFTDSWLDLKHSFVKEYDAMLEKYGKKRADMLMQMMYTHYKYFGYVDTGNGDFEAAAATAKPLADTVNTTIERLEAPYGALRKMITLDFDEDFIMIPPGQTVSYKAFQ